MEIKSIKQDGSGDLLEAKQNCETLGFVVEFKNADEKGINALYIECKIDKAEILEINPVCYEVCGSDEYDNDGEILLEIHSIECVDIYNFVNGECENLKSGLKMKYFDAVKDELIKFLNDTLN